MNVKILFIIFILFAKFSKPHSSILTTFPEEVFITSLYLSLIIFISFSAKSCLAIIYFRKKPYLYIIKF